VAEICLGYFGPGELDGSPAGMIWAGATLALEKIGKVSTASGERPLRLIPYWASDPWSAGVTRLARGVFTDGLWAVIGGIDGQTTHLAAQVAAKARLAVLSPGNTDKTSHLANVPWVFSILPGDDLLAGALSDYLVRQGLHREVVLLAGGDHDSRLFATELTNLLNRRGGGLRFRADFRPASGGVEGAVREVLRLQPACLVISARAAEAAEAVCQLRQGGYRRTIFGGPSFAERAFRSRLAVVDPELIFPLCWRPTSRTEQFIAAFCSRYGFAPDYLAAAGYDAVELAAEAVRRGGLNRARINDALRQLSPWEGVSGWIRWDNSGMNGDPPYLARLVGDKMEILRTEANWERFPYQDQIGSSVPIDTSAKR
jgi:ABC-type branched-subunit amino acid transport system substrate-binding protein